MKKKLHEFNVQICSPENKYEVTPVFDRIKTLENVTASLPYGSTSGEWGESGKSWTEQHGTPIGFEFTYYSRYEDKYYYIDQDFNLEQVKEMANRCYAIRDEDAKEYLERYISREKFDTDIDTYNNFYDCFNDLVFGFAPQGMIVVWFKYGYMTYELGRFQAKEITDAEKIKVAKKKYVDSYGIHPERYEEAKVELKVPNASCKQWDDYRLRYNWTYKVGSKNKNFRFLGFASKYF